MAKAKDESVMELPVTFGNVNLGDATAKVGVSISRANLTVSKCDKQLCTKRVTCTILARPNGASADQDSLPGLNNDTEMKGVADIKGFSVTGKAIKFGLTFNLSNIDVETFSHFAKRDGRLTIHGVEDLPEGEQDDDGDE